MKVAPKSQVSSSANDLAVEALTYLAQDMDRLGQFLALTGLDPATIRDAARSPGFLAGVLDHLMANDALLIAFAEEMKIRPEDVAAAREALVGPTDH